MFVKLSIVSTASLLLNARDGVGELRWNRLLDADEHVAQIDGFCVVGFRAEEYERFAIQTGDRAAAHALARDEAVQREMVKNDGVAVRKGDAASAQLGRDKNIGHIDLNCVCSRRAPLELKTTHASVVKRLKLIARFVSRTELADDRRRLRVLANAVGHSLNILGPVYEHDRLA